MQKKQSQIEKNNMTSTISNLELQYPVVDFILKDLDLKTIPGLKYQDGKYIEDQDSLISHSRITKLFDQIEKSLNEQGESFMNDQIESDRFGGILLKSLYENEDYFLFLLKHNDIKLPDKILEDLNKKKEERLNLEKYLHKLNNLHKKSIENKCTITEVIEQEIEARKPIHKKHNYNLRTRINRTLSK